MNMASFRQTLYSDIDPSKLDLSTFIMKIYTSTTIAFGHSTKTILKLQGPIDPTKIFLLSCFFADQWFSNGISINITLKLTIQ